jgi:hypothetical protein
MAHSRRRASRVSADFYAEYTVNGAAHAGTVRDVSVGGVFVETSALAPIGASVTLSFALPGQGATLSLPAVVRWTRTDGFGVQFALLGARETHALVTFIRSQPR